MLYFRYQTVLVLPEVLEGGHGVGPADVEDQLDPTRQHEVARVRLADPRVLVCPVGHVQHVRRGLLVKLVARHVRGLVLAWCQGNCKQELVIQTPLHIERRTEEQNIDICSHFLSADKL